MENNRNKTLLYIIISLLILSPITCGILTKFNILAKSIIFLVYPALTMTIGCLLVYNRFRTKYRIAGLLMAGIVAVTFGEASFLGMILDPRSVHFTWLYIAEITIGISIITFILIILAIPIYLFIFRNLRK